MSFFFSPAHSRSYSNITFIRGLSLDPRSCCHSLLSLYWSLHREPLSRRGNWIKQTAASIPARARAAHTLGKNVPRRYEGGEACRVEIAGRGSMDSRWHWQPKEPRRGPPLPATDKDMQRAAAAFGDLSPMGHSLYKQLSSSLYGVDSCVWSTDFFFPTR